NCNLTGGALFYLVLPVLSAVTATAAGVFAGLLARGRRIAVALALAIVLASIAWGLWRFYTTPPVFAFDPFVGWFPGSLYDEELEVSRALLVARGIHLLGACAALVLAAAFLDGRRLRLGV